MTIGSSRYDDYPFVGPVMNKVQFIEARLADPNTHSVEIFDPALQTGAVADPQRKRIIRVWVRD